MKTITTTLKPMIEDRPMLLLALLMGIVGIVYVLYAAFSLHSTELQVATHYTAFGSTQYYRDRWYYLLTFIAMAFIIVITHVGIMAKLRAREMRSVAMAFGWLSIIILAILFIITHSVLGIAYLS